MTHVTVTKKISKIYLGIRFYSTEIHNETHRLWYSVTHPKHKHFTKIKTCK
jgi:hypothetical protein